jgi:ornithine cyclodeaminase/alanine dehydrogenase-like protein (mu-crystallin family)
MGMHPALAVEDVATAARVYERAVAGGAGTRLAP